MMRRLWLFSLVALCACGPARYKDVTGPFTGVTYRFAVDQLLLPMQRSDYADDLNGDGRPDDQLGNVAGALAGQMDLTHAGDDMLASGALAPVLEITTDDPTLRNDPTVGVRFLGRDGEGGDVMGATLVDGTLTSNLTRYTGSPASATLHVPLFEYADPLAIAAVGLEVQLGPDGSGGLSGTIHGAFPFAGVLQPAYAGLVQMLAANPPEFSDFVALLDHDGDGLVSFDEFAHAGILENVMAPDVQLTDGQGRWSPAKDNGMKDSISFGLGLHLVPCPSGSCHAPPADLCQDRVRDGDETDVDCGGSCLACPGGARCTAAADCQSGQCNGGTCAAPSCSDGRQDGIETGVDCGGPCAAGCAVGSPCRDDSDCAGSFCNGAGAFFTLGVCVVPMCNDGVKDLDETGVDCGGHCPGCPKGNLCYGDSDCLSQHCDCSSDFFSCDGVCE